MTIVRAMRSLDGNSYNIGLTNYDKAIFYCEVLSGAPPTSTRFDSPDYIRYSRLLPYNCGSMRHNGASYR